MVWAKQDSVIPESSGARAAAQRGANSWSDAGAAGQEAGATMRREPAGDRRGDPNLVEFIDVEKIYGAFHAVRRLNSGIGRGEFLTFLGPSGATMALGEAIELCWPTSDCRAFPADAVPDGKPSNTGRGS